MSLANRYTVSLAVLLLAASPLALPILDAPIDHTAQQEESTQSWQPTGASAASFFTSNAGQAPAAFDVVARLADVSAGFSEAGATIRVVEGQFTMDPGFGSPELGEAGVPIRYITGDGIFATTSSNEVMYHGDGIHWKAYVNDGQLEFDHILEAGTDPAKASVTLDVPFTVAETATLHLAGGDVTLLPPFAYQADGTVVEVQFKKMGQQLGYELGSYDATQTLIIDPILQTSTYIGGTLLDEPTDSAVAPDGSVYVVGSTYSMDFPVTDDKLLNTLQDPPLLPSDHFGHAIATTTDRIAIGAPGATTGGAKAGLVYVYDTDLTLIQTLSEPTLGAHVPQDGDQFGASLAYVGNELFVGAPGDDSVVSNGGSVHKFAADGTHVFSIDAPGTDELVAGTPPEADQQFGFAMAAWSGNLAVGSPFENIVYQSSDIPDAGAVRVFTPGGTPISGGLTGYWSEVAYLNSIPTQGDNYGYSLAAAGAELMIGTPGDRGLVPTDPDGGAVHLVNPANNPVEYWAFDPALAAGGERLGESVAYLPSLALHVAGAPYEDTDGIDAGRAYLLLDDTCPQTMVPLDNPGASDGDLFGQFMASTTDHFAVGSPRDNQGAPDTGAAYQWSVGPNPGCGGVELDLSFEHPTPADGQRTGSALAYFGDRIAIGAPGSTLQFLEEGEVLLFDVESQVYDSTKEDVDQEGWVAHYESNGDLDFITYIGGELDDVVHSVVVDEAGDVYLGGGTHSPDFPIWGQPYMSGNQGLIVAKDTSDGFLTKMSGDGSGLLFSTYFGGYEDDWISDIALDENGHIAVGGSTDSGNFPIAISTNGQAVMQSTKGGDIDGFLAKFNPQGSGIDFSTYFGGDGDDYLTAMDIDEMGFLYGAGYTKSTDLPVLSLVQDGIANELFWDGFFVKIYEDGRFRPSAGPGDPGGPVYSGYLGGDANDYIFDATLNEDRELHMVGQTYSAAVFEPRFPLVLPAFDEVRSGPSDGFLSILEADGRNLRASTYIGGGNEDTSFGIEIGAGGDILTVGETFSPDFPIIAPTVQQFRKGSSDAWYQKFDANGKDLSFGTYFGGNGDEAGKTLALDGRGAAFVAGTTSSLDLPVVNAHQPGLIGGTDGFVSKFQDSPPTVDFTHDAGETTYTLEDITFEDASIEHSDGNIAEYNFSFGDDNYALGEGPHVHQYAKAGVYTVTLTVTTDTGLQVSTSKDITVLNRVPIADFTFSPDDPTDFHEVTFTDASEDEDGEVVGWFWDFGDGTTSDVQNPTHTFGPGTFTVELTVFDDEDPLPASSEPVTTSITIRKGLAPTAAYTISPDPPNAGDVMTFNDASTDPDGTIESWSWDFGDGTTAEGVQVTHIYEAKGIYTLTLTVVDDDGIESVLVEDVDVTNRAPTAGFSRSVVEPTAADLVKFFDLSSDVDGTIVSWHWDFHDGTVAQVPNPSHRFGVNAAEQQRVTLTVTDDEGATDTYSVQFWVRDTAATGGGGAGASVDGGYVAPVQGNVGSDDDGECPTGTLPEDGVCTQVVSQACPINQFWLEEEQKCVAEIDNRGEVEETPVTAYTPTPEPTTESSDIPTGLWVAFIVMAVLVLTVGVVVAIIVVKRA